MPDWLEIAIRTLVAVIALFIATKILGKRQVSQLSFFEYITGITIGNLIAYTSLELQTSWYLGIISLIVWVSIALGIEFLQLKSKTARTFIDGKTTVLIQQGKILEENLKKERLTTDELLEQLRKKNVFLVSDVEFALIEPSGDFNILLKKENQPLTPKHLGIEVGPTQDPQAVIMDGNILDEPLSHLGLNRHWLKTELEKLGVTLENVFLGQVDSYGQLYVDLYNDQIQVAQPQEKALLLATLKKCEADLEMYSLSTNNPNAKAMYATCSEQLQDVIREVKPLLNR
ncbi:DUF421 domain-containing protein [Thermoflavimicrobium daqui]|jgi:uncharacterized membrane protein YcaP (DUF421 family)|uniref:YetF C-terminal domain-containing protein n=1 Tax=Thermoflavimicrobium daqui TaxID=2137476 RepID=A0A364K4F5_9BACL|nr:DUF421 domain-containing protein [Thermoflavimicrobium daqui]RAL24250.1 hypothetical protein DL897_11260 [Thermoflavimicrobium daqui]